MSIQIIAPATTLPFTVGELRDQIRVSSDAENPYYEQAILAAVARVQTTLGIAVMEQGWRVTVPLGVTAPIEDRRSVRLPIAAKVVSLDAVNVLDSSGDEHALDTGDVRLDTAVLPYRLHLKSGVSWPAHAVSVAVDLTVGHAAPGDLPSDLVMLLRFYAAWLAEHRELSDGSEQAEQCFRWLSAPLKSSYPV